MVRVFCLAVALRMGGGGDRLVPTFLRVTNFFPNSIICGGPRMSIVRGEKKSLLKYRLRIVLIFFTNILT